MCRNHREIYNVLRIRTEKNFREEKENGLGNMQANSGIGYCRRTFSCEGIYLVFVYNAQINFLFVFFMRSQILASVPFFLLTHLLCYQNSRDVTSKHKDTGNEKLVTKTRSVGALGLRHYYYAMYSKGTIYQQFRHKYCRYETHPLNIHVPYMHIGMFVFMNIKISLNQTKSS